MGYRGRAARHLGHGRAGGPHALGLHQRRHLHGHVAAHGHDLGAEREDLQRYRLRLPRHLPQQVRRGRAPDRRRVLPALLRHRAEGERGARPARLSTASERQDAMSEAETPIERFKRATAAAMRAIAERDDLTASFAAGQFGLAGTEAKLPLPGRELPEGEVAVTRGSADALALRLRHHDDRVHRRESPTGDAARDIFEAVEQARVEAIGSRRMAGCALNLSAALDERARERGYARIRSREDAPLAEVLSLLAREAMTGQQPPPQARGMVDLWRPVLDERVRSDLSQLAKVIDDQSAYAKVVRKLLTDLQVDLGADSADSSDDEGDGEGDRNKDDADETRGEGGEKDSGEAQATMQGQPGDPGEEGDESGALAEADADTIAGAGEEESPRPGRPRRPEF